MLAIEEIYEDKLIFRFSIILSYFNLLTDGEMTWFVFTKVSDPYNNDAL